MSPIGRKAVKATHAIGNSQTSAMTMRNTCRATRCQRILRRGTAAGWTTAATPVVVLRARAHAVSLRIVRVRKITIGTSEITSSTTAMADPNPIRLASLSALLVISVDSSSSPFLPLLMM